MRHRVLFFSIVGVFQLACGDSGATTMGTAASTGSTGASMTSSSGSGGGTGGAGGAFVEPIVPAACAAPVVTPGATWNALSGEHFFATQLGSNGQDAALAYAESMGSGWTIKVQPLSMQGMTTGAPIVVGTTVGMQQPTIGFAMGSSASVLCFDRAVDGSQIACFAVKSDGTAKAGG